MLDSIDIFRVAKIVIERRINPANIYRYIRMKRNTSYTCCILLYFFFFFFKYSLLATVCYFSQFSLIESLEWKHHFIIRFRSKFVRYEANTEKNNKGKIFNLINNNLWSKSNNLIFLGSTYLIQHFIYLYISLIHNIYNYLYYNIVT